MNNNSYLSRRRRIFGWIWNLILFSSTVIIFKMSEISYLGYATLFFTFCIFCLKILFFFIRKFRVRNQQLFNLHLNLMQQGEFSENDYELLLQLDNHIEKKEIPEILMKDQIEENAPEEEISEEKAEELKETNKACSICLEEFNKGEMIRTLPCNHIFHSTEIEAWLKIQNFCPICKKRIDQNLEDKKSV
eukprot:TRINITY_DN110_c4_g1_i1.p1 TRINITY_DN110_c4_g1~~TRINITY_DN110_c4_g1_i1.p1  ORF type:complete len:190 (+),score=43.55 TRINITY_DN110_c4_g1_i1:47-616(+)